MATVDLWFLINDDKHCFVMFNMLLVFQEDYNYIASSHIL